MDGWRLREEDKDEERENPLAVEAVVFFIYLLRRSTAWSCSATGT
jgi:hypothetical protein